MQTSFIPMDVEHNLFNVYELMSNVYYQSVEVQKCMKLKNAIICIFFQIFKIIFFSSKVSAGSLTRHTPSAMMFISQPVFLSNRSGKFFQSKLTSYLINPFYLFIYCILTRNVPLEASVRDACWFRPKFIVN